MKLIDIAKRIGMPLELISKPKSETITSINTGFEIILLQGSTEIPESVVLSQYPNRHKCKFCKQWTPDFAPCTHCGAPESEEE